MILILIASAILHSAGWLWIRSLTERLRAQSKNLLDESNEKEAILECLAEGVVSIDATMKIKYANAVSSKILRMPKRHLIGKDFPTIAYETVAPLLEKCKVLLKACQERQSVLTDSISIGEGKKLYLDLIAAPIPEDGGAIIVLQDKSNHYKILEIGKDFVSNASHELRTPITIIKGFAETLQDLPELSKEMLDSITEKIVRNCERMDNLVKNLLILADIENLPKTRFYQCDLISLAENCRHVLLSIHSDVHVEIEKDREDMVVEADLDLLELAIMNLLNNGIKYSKHTAHLTMKLRQLDEKEVKIEIIDQGIGIPSSDLEHIFERFYTVDKARSRRLGGAGLGLSIVKTIIEKHDGTISVESTVGKGTGFSIVLPIHRFKFD